MTLELLILLPPPPSWLIRVFVVLLCGNWKHDSVVMNTYSSFRGSGFGSPHHSELPVALVLNDPTPFSEAPDVHMVHMHICRKTHVKNKG